MEQKKKEDEMKKFGENLNEKYINNLKSVFKNIEDTLKNLSDEKSKEIMNDIKYRNKFSRLCQEAGIDPIICKKSIWTNMSDFYNKLALKLLFIMEKKRNLNGGIIKVNCLMVEYNNLNSNKINRDDLLNSLKYLNKLGSGCKIIDDKYININHFLVQNEYFIFVELCEKYQYINYEIMKKEKDWDYQRFILTINKYIKEGLTWVDKQTGTDYYNYYFLVN